MFTMLQKAMAKIGSLSKKGQGKTDFFSKRSGLEKQRVARLRGQPFSPYWLSFCFDGGN